jgi:hypothetical protein
MLSNLTVDIQHYSTVTEITIFLGGESGSSDIFGDKNKKISNA